MSKEFPVVRVCHVCGKENVFNRAITTGELDWPDLDTRPPKTNRTLLKFWIQTCEILGCEHLNEDPRFTSKPDRVTNIGALTEALGS